MSNTKNENKNAWNKILKYDINHSKTDHLKNSYSGLKIKVGIDIDESIISLKELKNDYKSLKHPIGITDYENLLEKTYEISEKVKELAKDLISLKRYLIKKYGKLK